MSVESDVADLKVRLKVIEERVEALAKASIPIASNSTSQSIWVLKQTLEAKKELAEHLYNDKAYVVADGVRWRDLESRKIYRRLQLEIHHLMEELAK